MKSFNSWPSWKFSVTTFQETRIKRGTEVDESNQELFCGSFFFVWQDDSLWVYKSPFRIKFLGSGNWVSFVEYFFVNSFWRKVQGYMWLSEYVYRFAQWRILFAHTGINARERVKVFVFDELCGKDVRCLYDWTGGGKSIFWRLICKELFFYAGDTSLKRKRCWRFWHWMVVVVGEILIIKREDFTGTHVCKTEGSMYTEKICAPQRSIRGIVNTFT